jgi:aspartyl-tRNA synthetase
MRGRSGFAGLQGWPKSCARNGWCGSTARCAAPRRHRESGPADRAEVEVYVSEIEVLGPAGELPLPVFGEQEYPEDTRLKYRFLDLRREKLHKNIMLRGAIVDSMRRA